MEKLGALIAAAGKSSRMDGFKPLLPLKNSTVIEQMIENFKSAGVTEITVVTGREANLMRDTLKKHGVNCIENRDFAETDMFYSIKLGLSVISGERIFITPADIPLVKPESLLRMLEEKADIILPAHRKKLGHPLLIKNSMIPEICGYTGENGLNGAIKALGKAAEVPLRDFGILLDADNRQDYALIRLLSEIPENIRRHCETVAYLAADLAQQLNSKGYLLDIDTIELAALLHDMTRMEKNHAETAADILKNLGFIQLSEIIRQHMLPDLTERNKISEITIVFLADKLVLDDKIVNLDRRFSGKQNKYPKAGEIYKTALNILRAVTDAGISIPVNPAGNQ